MAPPLPLGQWPFTLTLLGTLAQVLLDDPTGTSYGIPQYLFTSAEDCYPARGVDGGAGTPCPAAPGVIGTDKSYTVVETIVH